MTQQQRLVRRGTGLAIGLAMGLAGGLAVGLAIIPRDAAACGGTFCDAGPQGPMPVDQTGENVIFVMGGSEIEVHIQISVDPESTAEKFGWLVPLGSVPQFSVGSQPFFAELLAASVPTYGLNTSFETCDEGQGQGSGFTGGGGSGAPTSSDGDPGWTEGDDNEDEPTILKQETVGAFEIVVLTDKTVGPIRDWLIDNGYVWDEKAEPILTEYLNEGNVIAAFKLAGGADLADVHPITLRYSGFETCFPLRLTRIAAVEDMDIRVFVLGEHRAVPTNFRHVLVNPLKIDWLQFAANYKQVITNAVDAFMADGRAFVTEYAGPSNIVATSTIYDPKWDSNEFIGLPVVQVVDLLNGQGLATCHHVSSCEWNHPLMLPLLQQALPVPDGLEPATFYANLADYADDIDLDAWGNGEAFASLLEARIIEPGLHAETLLKTWPYLTRLYTTISPTEMTQDPIFHQNPELDDVPSLRVAERLLLCNGDAVVTLPDGREVYVPTSGPWPQIPDDAWFSEEIQTIALKGAPMTLVNNTAAINTTLAAWNLTHNWPRTSDSSSSDSDSTSQQDDGGCGCRSTPAPNAALGLGLAMLGLASVRRRRSPTC